MNRSCPYAHTPPSPGCGCICAYLRYLRFLSWAGGGACIREGGGPHPLTPTPPHSAGGWPGGTGTDSSRRSMSALSYRVLRRVATVSAVFWLVRMIRA